MDAQEGVSQWVLWAIFTVPVTILILASRSDRLKRWVRDQRDR